MTETQTGEASIFTALLEWERKNGGGGGGGKPRVEVQAKGGKLRLGGFKGIRRFHPGHRLSGQRINNIVKVKFVPNNKDARRHIMAHLDYIQNREREINEPERKFYGRDGERSTDDVLKSMMRNRGDDAAMFKIILSPKQNELNHILYSTEIMRRFEEKTGIVTDWALVEHRNTEHHHVHIVMPGCDLKGNSYRLERYHLELLRELANEYQYELQDLVYEREKQVQYEFGMTRDEANLLLEASRNRHDMKEIGVYDPELDQQVREELLPRVEWDNLYFRGQLERELMLTAYDHVKQVHEALIEKHPELFQGFIHQLQTQKINDEYFSRLKGFYPQEYERYLNDPNLDRSEVVDRLKQAFPEWFDPIVEQLKEQMPDYFVGYQKPAPTERQIIENLQESNPELFPELSKQIQEHQKNLFAMAYLANNNPGLFKQINEEPDPSKQMQMLLEAQKEFPENMKEAERAFAQRQPEIYKHGEKTPTQAEFMKNLMKTNPLVFPAARAQLKRMEIDNALFGKFKEAYPDAPEKFETEANARAMVLNIIRTHRPDLLESAIASVKEKQPELFLDEKTEPSQTEIIQALIREKPELFPQAMRQMKEQEMDKAYFDRAKELIPDLQRYIDDPNLDRSALHKSLRNTYPDWQPEIEAELKEKMPQLFKYDLPKSNQGTFEESKPDLSEKIAEIKEQLIDEAYFERGRKNLSEGLQDYLANSEYDRQHIIHGIRESFPEWLKEIENELRELHPLLFFPSEKMTVVQKEVLEKLLNARKESLEESRSNVRQEAGLLLALSAGIDSLQKQVDDKEESQLDPSKDAEIEEKSKNALQDADKFQLGHGWAGLTGIHHGAFVAEPIDLQGEAKQLFEDQRELAQEIQEVSQHAQVIDPKVFQIEDIVRSVEERIEEHEKEKEHDERT